jgi:hypothetical protein
MTKAAIPEAVLHQHTAFLGKTGSGKTSTAKLAIEQVVAAGARVCVLDPIKSDWWGLTSSADGKKPGLPFHILGGPRGHVPLHSSAGKAIGEIVATGQLRHSIIDMADFEAGGVQRFFCDFAPALLRHARGVLYLVIEEAHELAPKERSGFEKENMALHWAKKLATAGRSKGIRLMVLTQRVQALHNAVLGSCESLVAHRLSAPADQKPVLDWLKANASAGVQEMVSAQLAALKTGSGWICSGEAQIFERRDFPRIHTFDNTATPTGDGEAVAVKQAPVDQEKLRAIIGDAVAEAEAQDPKALRTKLVAAQRDLEALKKAKAPAPAGATKAELAAEYSRGRQDGQEAALRALSPFMDRMNTLASAQKEHVDGFHAELARISAKAPAKPQTSAPPARAAAAARPAPARPPAEPSDGLSGPQQRILDALAWLEAVGITDAHRVQLALLAKASPKSSSYANNLGALRSASLIGYVAGRVVLTPEGRGAARAPETPPTTADLHATLRAELAGPQWRILEQLIGAYPEAVDKSTLADLAGTSASSSSYANNLGALRSLGFIDYPSGGQVVALPVLFLER